MRYSQLTDRIAGQASRAWELAARAYHDRLAGRDVISLIIGDPDFDTPAFVTKAALSAIEAGDTHYSDPGGIAPLREAIAEVETRLLERVIEPSAVTVTTGAQAGLYMAASLLVDPGDVVIVPEPVYVTYLGAIEQAGATVETIPAVAADGFRPDLDALAAAITPRTRALFLANPNNPSGHILTDTEIDRLAALATAHDLWVVSDEVYETIVFDAPMRSLAARADLADRVIKLGSLSKSMAMTGWRIGWMVGPRAFAIHANRLAQAMHYGLQPFLQQAAVTALKDGAADVERMRLAYRRRRDLLAAALGPLPGLKVVVPPAGMFMLVDITATGLDANAFATALYEATGVAVLDAEPFGRSLAGHVRITFAKSDEDLSEAARRIARFVGERFA
jgi:arginine:pyruvate transaminase